MDKVKRLYRCVNWTFVVLMSLCSFHSPLFAQDQGWTVNPHDFQYHMSVYALLNVDGDMETDQDRYELAAFVGDECRGVAVEDSSQGYSWLYLRVWSNSLSGEDVTFKVYDKETKKSIDIVESLPFENLGLIGEPSLPKQLTFRTFTPGDVNDDGLVAINDVVLAINAILGKTPEHFILAAADMNGDGQVMINDVVLIINVVLGVRPTSSQVRSLISRIGESTNAPIDNAILNDEVHLQEEVND